MEAALLLLLLLPALSLPACQLERVRGEPTARSVTLAWDPTDDCQGNIKRYEVQWEHAKYLACPDGRRDTSLQGSGVQEMAFSKANIQSLHPHSIYMFTIKTTANDRSTVPLVTINVTTKMAEPQTQPAASVASSQTKSTIFFYWADPEDCELQNGQRDRFEVGLEGLDIWDSGHKVLAHNKIEDTSFLAHQLQPYSKYRLSVFNRNYDSRAGVAYVNRERPLQIQERTLATHPAAPARPSSSSQTETSVFLSWVPSFPPTGHLDRFQLQYGTPGPDGPTWRHVAEMSATNLCPEGAAYCYSVTGLKAATEHLFRVRAWNTGVETASPWSGSLRQATRRSSTPETSAPPAEPSSISPPAERSVDLVTIFSLLAGIVMMVAFLICLVYKLKISRLKQQIRQEEEWNGTLSHSISHMPGEASAASTRLGDSYLTSLETSTDRASFHNDSIQGRRLPELPGPSEPQYSEAYELVPVPGVFQPAEGYVSPLESTRIQEEEVTDVEGYLRPTFADRSSPIPGQAGGWSPGGLIPPESYGEVGPGSLGSRTSPSQPLISDPVNV